MTPDDLELTMVWPVTEFIYNLNFLLCRSRARWLTS